MTVAVIVGIAVKKYIRLPYTIAVDADIYEMRIKDVEKELAKLKKNIYMELGSEGYLNEQNLDRLLHEVNVEISKYDE
ncbi:MAG: hypothetical protein V1859_11545 [archaeon]